MSSEMISAAIEANLTASSHPTIAPTTISDEDSNTMS